VLFLYINNTENLIFFTVLSPPESHLKYEDGKRLSTICLKMPENGRKLQH
ncbi:unnamed protein product, partial [Larinioides sclopetarius]